MNSKHAERLRREAQEQRAARKPEPTEEATEAAETEATPKPERKAPTITELNIASRRRRMFK